MDKLRIINALEFNNGLSLTKLKKKLNYADVYYLKSKYLNSLIDEKLISVDKINNYECCIKLTRKGYILKSVNQFLTVEGLNDKLSKITRIN